MPSGLRKINEKARLYLDVLDAAIVGDDGILEVFVPEVQLCEVTQQVLVHHLELAGQHPANKEMFMYKNTLCQKLKKFRDEQPGSYFLELRNHFFGLK
jgi:hypothetical protein